MQSRKHISSDTWTNNYSHINVY